MTFLRSIVNAVPKPANAAPLAEKTGADKGAITGRYALEDHQHPRLTSTTIATITAGSTATVMFTRAFSNEPGTVFTEIGGDTSANAQPASFKVQSWMRETMTPTPSGAYVGAVVRAWRSQVVPQTLTTLLLSAVYNLFTASVVGTRFSIIAVARSDV